MKKYKKTICLIAAVCLLGAAAFCGYHICDHYAREAVQSEAFEDIAGTTVNYPVMQTPQEPNYYLKRNSEKTYSDLGTPYVQEDCNLKESDNLIIYGHHIKGGKMFGALESYKDKGFYEQHKTIQSTPSPSRGNMRLLPYSRP